MCAVTYLVQSITNFVPNIKKLVNYCLFLCSVRYDFWDRRCEERSDEAIQWPEFVEVAH